MGKVNTDKKLELVKSIRMQNQYNRQLFRSREGFLYGNEPEMHRGELFSLESPDKQPMDGEGGHILSGFRIRFMIAVMLFIAFIFCDVNQLSYGSETTDTLYGRISKNIVISDLFDGL